MDQHGEGLKLGLVVLAKLGYYVTIETDCERWTFTYGDKGDQIELFCRRKLLDIASWNYKKYTLTICSPTDRNVSAIACINANNTLL